MKKFKFLFLLCFALLITESCQKDPPEIEDIQQEEQDVEQDMATQISNALAKLDYNEKKFFEYDYLETNHTGLISGNALSTENEELVKEIIDEVILQNDNEPFIKGIIAEYGYAGWSRAEVLTADNNPDFRMLNIPFTQFNDKQITAYLSVNKYSDDNLTFNFYKKIDITQAVINNLPETAEPQLAFEVAQVVRFDTDLFDNPDELLIHWLSSRTLLNGEF